MPDEVQIFITSARTCPERERRVSGLDEKDFDLTKTKIWIDGAPRPIGRSPSKIPSR